MMIDHDAGEHSVIANVRKGIIIILEMVLPSW